MPFASEKQRRYMYMKHPEIAKRWTAEAKSKGVKAVQNDDQHSDEDYDDHDSDDINLEETQEGGDPEDGGSGTQGPKKQVTGDGNMGAVKNTLGGLSEKIPNKLRKPSLRKPRMNRPKLPIVNDDEEMGDEEGGEDMAMNAAADYAVELACVLNEWSDAARAAALEARRRKFHQDSALIEHEPGGHAYFAQTYRAQAARARKGGFLRSPNEETASHYDAMAKMHEDVENDPKFHRAEKAYHEGKAATHGVKALGYAPTGSKLGHGTIGALAGGTVGLLAGGAVGGAPGALFGGALGATAGFSSGVHGATSTHQEEHKFNKDYHEEAAKYHQVTLGHLKPRGKKFSKTNH